MTPKALSMEELVYWYIRLVCKAIAYPFQTLGNWATDKLNESCYKLAIRYINHKEGKEFWVKYKNGDFDNDIKKMGYKKIAGIDND